MRPIWRKEREERMRTAQNRAETRKHQIIRERVTLERALADTASMTEWMR